MSRIAIVDSGGANIASLLYAFERLGIGAELTTDAGAIRTAERVVLPGVGAARDAMQRLERAGLVDVIRGLEQPVLGICLGMQLLCEASEEEDVECLGIIPGTARKLAVSEGCAVPNMGWCATHPVAAHPVLDGFISCTVTLCPSLQLRLQALVTLVTFQLWFAGTISSPRSFTRSVRRMRARGCCATSWSGRHENHPGNRPQRWQVRTPAQRRL
jgi:hypothetical protein